MRGLNKLGAAAAVLAALWAGTARAEDTLRLAVGQRGNWDTSVAELGQQAGIFKKHGLSLEILYTGGGAETQQAVLARSADIGVAAGTLGALGAASKGAPLRIIGGETTGAAELFWYVPAASAIRSAQDLNGHTVAFSTAGSSSNSVALGMEAQDHLSFKLVGTGGLPGTYTQVMSGQVDSGWSAAPFGIEALDGGKIRAVFRGSDVRAARDQTVRSLVTHAAVLAAKKPLLDRFMQAYRETLDWMYGSPDAIPTYAKFAGVSEAVARRTRDDFFPKSALDPNTMTGLDALMADGVQFKFLAAPLDKAQLAQVIQLQGGAP